MPKKVEPPAYSPVPEELNPFLGQKGLPLERVRLAIVELTRRKEKLTNVAVRQESQASANVVTPALRLYKAGRMPPIFQPWDTARATPSTDGPNLRAGLERMIRAAKTDGDREEISQEVGALVAAGVLAPDEGALIIRSMAEARHAADAKRANEPPPEDPTRLLLASPEALLAAETLDRFVSDARRDRLLALIAAEREIDLIESPNADEGGGSG